MARVNSQTACVTGTAHNFKNLCVFGVTREAICNH